MLVAGLCLGLLLLGGRRAASRPALVGTWQAPPTVEVPFPHTWQFRADGVLVLTLDLAGSSETRTARYALPDAHTLLFWPRPGAPPARRYLEYADGDTVLLTTPETGARVRLQRVGDG